MRPVLFYIPLLVRDWKVPIYGYGVMLGLSLIVGWYIVLGLCERDGMDREKMGKLYVWTAVCSVAGSRLLYVLTNLDRFTNFVDIFKVNQGGLVAYGGFLGGFLCGVIYCRKMNIPLLAWADCVVPSLGTGLGITRIGCFLFGCDFGKPSSVAWAVRFPKDSPAWAEQLRQGLVQATDLHSVSVHPTQIYEALTGWFLFGLVMLVRRYRTFSGQMFIAFTMAYAVLRFYLETLRADAERGEIGPFSTSQVIGVATFFAAGVLYLVLRRRSRENPQALRLWEPQAAVLPAVAPRPVKRRRRR